MSHQQEEDDKESALPPPAQHPCPAGTALLLRTSPQHHVGGHKLDLFLELLRSELKREIGEATDSTCRKEFMRKCKAVLVATDVHPRFLVGHLPGLAASRQVPLIFISGSNGTGSLRLGEIFKLRTAIAVGLKVGDSGLNRMIRGFLKDNRGSGLEPS